jgi:hypothetical protein
MLDWVSYCLPTRLHCRQLFLESGLSPKKKQSANKKKLGAVSSSLFITQEAKKEKSFTRRKIQSPMHLLLSMKP